ncbi:transcriptional regulator family: Fungal Specific TF [Penicillium hetheringtonii]|uniref:Transcriptional regulator family: Fungal Specific TF n=1 Tax=Penicillium hetheringtonii TaxID=911720 RepID=A0AAD6DRP7_9EURO|nr:transcriptional regulator family: Fungal Specific TF [Penicillium hetheringtonii]
MASPSSVSSRVEDHEPDWQYGPRPKRRKRDSTVGTSKPSPREIGFMRESQSNGSASFLGSSSGIHFIRHVYNVFARRSADLQQTKARDKSSVPGEDDRLQRGPLDTDNLWLPGELDFMPNPTYTFEDLVNWTRHYFENWHPIFPCLHAPTVLKSMEKLGHHGFSALNQTELTIIRSIMSISLDDNRQIEKAASKVGPIPASLVFSTVQHVMQDIQSILAEPTTLPLLQATFLAQLALTSLLRLNAASRVGGVITRTAFHLGLHRCPGRFSVFTTEEVEIRRRLFWSIYCLERYLSQALGIPLGIRDDDIDVCYPSDEQHAAATSAGPLPDDHRLRLLSHLAKFARIRGLILELRNKSILHSHAGAVEASHVNGELSQWWNEVYDDVDPVDEGPSSPGEDLGLGPYHRLLLKVLRHEAIISMNRPLLAAERPGPKYKNALQTCIESSRTLLADLKKYLLRSADVPLTWPSFTWTTWMACLILMYASWEGELPVTTALKYAKMGVSVLENLALRGSSWPETCIEAIKGMESALTSTKSLGTEVIRENTSHASRPGPGEQYTKTPDRSAAENIIRQSNSIGNLSASHDRVPSARQDNQSLGTQNMNSALSPSAVHVVDSGDPSMLSPYTTHGNPTDVTTDSQCATGQFPAGLIFGNVANANAPFHPGISGQDQFPFSDPSSLFMSDMWSVADGPWMIHGDLV